MLLDTGSYGLRLFTQVSLDGFSTVTGLLPLNLVADSQNPSHVLAECIQYAGGTSDWGPLATADVVLGETASSVPIQIIDSTFASNQVGCPNPDGSPLTSGFNGILGVGLLIEDCGPNCAPGAPNAANNNVYFSCPATGAGACSGAAVPVSQQAANPVARLPVDNNGVIVELPSVPAAFGLNDGSTAADGFLVLGIGTQANNQPVGTTSFPTDQFGDFVTTFNGSTSTSSFIDSGSNALFFSGPSSLPICPGTAPANWYCPSSEATFTASQQGAGGVRSADRRV